MKFARHLYVSAELKKKKEKIVSRIREGKVTRPLCLLALTDYGTKRLEIVSTIELLQHGCPRDKITIFGMAGDYETALELVRTILQEAYAEGMADDLCGFLEDREREK